MVQVALQKTKAKLAVLEEKQKVLEEEAKVEQPKKWKRAASRGPK